MGQRVSDIPKQAVDFLRLVLIIEKQPVVLARRVSDIEKQAVVLARSVLNGGKQPMERIFGLYGEKSGTGCEISRHDFLKKICVSPNVYGHFCTIGKIVY